MTENSQLPLETQLNLETGRIAWRELQRFFASGHAVAVAPGLDLVKVGSDLARDNANQWARWMESGQVALVSDQQAQAWHEADAQVWALVIKPWVLVQAPS